MSWQERRCNAEGFGRPEPFFFLCEERFYSPPRRGGGIACGNRALCEADAASAEALWTMPQLCGAAVIACGAQSGVVQNEPDHFRTLRQPATGSFIAVMDGTCCPSIFFFGKETKTPPCGEQKGRDKLWQSIIWKQRL